VGFRKYVKRLMAFSEGPASSGCRGPRWEKLSATGTGIGTLVDDAMIAMKHENPSLRDVLLSQFASAGGQLDRG
jgi:hypothetical protein